MSTKIKCLLFMNSSPTEWQLNDLSRDFGVEQVAFFREHPLLVDPYDDTGAVCRQAEKICGSMIVTSWSFSRSIAVVQLEPCLQTCLVMMLQDRGFRVMHPTTEKVVSVDPDTGEKRSYFNHVKFRAYPKL